MMAVSRIMHDIRHLRLNPVDGIVLGDIDNPMHFNAYISGPEDCSYNSGLFEVDVRIPENFPYEPPTVYFTTPIFHPNIDHSTGLICVDLLDTRWAPGCSIGNVLEVIRTLLCLPNYSSPLNGLASSMKTKNPELYEDTIKTWTFHFGQGSYCVPYLEEKIRAAERDGGKTRKETIFQLTKNFWA